MKIKEEPDASAPNAHLPALPVKHRSKTSKHSSLDTADFVQATNETSKPTPSEGKQVFIIISIQGASTFKMCCYELFVIKKMMENAQFTRRHCG